MSFNYGEGAWWVVFWDNDRMRTPLPRKAHFTTDEALIEFTRRASGLRTSEDRNIFDMMIRRSFDEIRLTLTPEQYAKLEQPRSANPLPKGKTGANRR
jgi:hypothetical protein